MIMNNNNSRTILITDDDTAHRTMMKVNLAESGYTLLEASDGDEVLPLLQQNHVDLILLDMKMARMDGLATLSALAEAGYEVPVIVITAFSSVETAVEAMRRGAFDYVAKPIDIDELNIAINKALDFHRLHEENEQLKDRLQERFSYSNIIGNSQVMQEMFSTLSLVAPSDATVLLTGESGTGKELVANALHENSSRRDFPFIKVNCAALHENLLESELFGHEKGAFTGASEQRKGRFELSHKGTLFLDEIGDMSLQTQAKILRVLQEGEFERLGGNRTMNTDVRLVAATHKDLQSMVGEGTFRQDLYFRLSVVPIELPPLRERSGDLPELSNYFLKKYANKNNKDIKGFHPEVLNHFIRYQWPGNIRELENTIERAVILCLGENITARELPHNLFPEGTKTAVPPLPQEGFTLRDMERELIRSTLDRAEGNKSKTAKILGVARQTLLNKIKEYGLS